jgi:PEP-CTERM motif
MSRDAATSALFVTGVKFMKKFVLAFAAGTMALCAAAPASAATILWTLRNVTFNDGGQASGTFSTDSNTGLATAFNISTTAGSILNSAFNYTASNSQIFFIQNAFSPQSFIVVTNPFDRYINLAFVNSLAVGGVNPLRLGPPINGSWECLNCGNLRSITGGVATSVPEPAAWALMIAGFGLVGAAARRRQSVRVTYA